MAAVMRGHFGPSKGALIARHGHTALFARTASDVIKTGRPVPDDAGVWATQHFKHGDRAAPPRCNYCHIIWRRISPALRAARGNILGKKAANYRRFAAQSGNAHGYFAHFGGAITCGPTLTNVTEFRAAIILPPN